MFVIKMSVLFISLFWVNTLCTTKGSSSIELVMVLERGILHGNINNDSIYFRHRYNWGQFTRIVTDAKNQVCFLYESSTKVIFKSQMWTDDNFQDIVLATGKVEDMAVDDINRNLYWADSFYGFIGVTSYDGTVMTKLIKDTNCPKALAIDSSERILFWSDLGEGTLKQLYIEELTTTVIMAGVFATSVTTDTTQHILYILEAHTKQLWKYMYTEPFSRLIKLQQNTRINSLSAFPGGYLTTSESEHGHLAISLWSNVSNRSYVTSNRIVHHITALLSYQNKAGKKINREINSEKSEDYCIPSLDMSSPYLCKDGVVGSGQSTDKDSRLEYTVRPFLLVADQRGRVLYKIDCETMENYVIPVTGLDQPYGIAYDSHSNQVYWTDIGRKHNSISKSNIDGSFQEIVFHHEYLYSTDIEIDSARRLAVFVDFSFHRLGVIHLPSMTYRYILEMEDFHPFSLFITRNIFNRHSPDIFISTHGRFPRMIKTGIDGGNYTTTTAEAVKPRGLYVNDKNIYWIESYKYNKNTLMMVNTETGSLSTILNGKDMRDIQVYRDKFLFISDAGSGHLKRFDLSNFNETSEKWVTNSAVEHIEMFAPSGMAIVDVDKYARPKLTCRTSCNGVCIGNDKCLTGFQDIPEINRSKGFCTIPSFRDEIILHKAREGSIVHNGYKMAVTCKGGLRLHNYLPIQCVSGSWDNLPNCILDYKIHGTKNKGWTQFLQSGQFYIFPEIIQLSIIVIGGGGGGFNKGSANTTQGGDGEFSQFMSVRAEGGKGGVFNIGGKGGVGNYYNGKNGIEKDGCNRGGSCAGTNRMSQLLCGDGGYSSECNKTCGKHGNKLTNHGELVSKTKTCGIDGGLFGGGSVGNGGGSGGGGGFSCNVIYEDFLPENRVVDVIVGRGGNPSYAIAGCGLVLITWGVGDACALREWDFTAE